MTFATYELVANPSIQQKLYEEIMKTNAELDGKRITYDALQRMTYMDQIVSETLRKWYRKTEKELNREKYCQFE